MRNKIEKKETSHYIIYKITIIRTIIGMIREIEIFIDKKTNKICRYHEVMGNPFKSNALRMYYAFQYDERGRPSSVILKKSRAYITDDNVRVAQRKTEFSVQYQLEWDAQDQISRYVDKSGNWWDANIIQTPLPFDLRWNRIQGMHDYMMVDLETIHDELIDWNKPRAEEVSNLMEYIEQEGNSLPHIQNRG
jgi:YD repeat-containing protein